METSINTLSTPISAQNSRVEEYKNEKSKIEAKKKKVYIAKAAVSKKESGKSRRLAAAILAIFIGIIFLARNFGILQFDAIQGLLMIWPLALIVAGICIAAKDGWWPVGLAATTLVVVSAMTIMLARGVFDEIPQNPQIIEADKGIIIEQDQIFN